jgi:hypothetical protein
VRRGTGQAMLALTLVYVVVLLAGLLAFVVAAMGGN